MVNSAEYNDWQAFLVQTTTGAVGPAVKIKEGAKFSIPLSDGGNATFSIDKTAIPALDLKRWLDQWWTTILFTFKGTAIFAGPLIANPKEYMDELQCEATDIRSILDRRFIIKEDVLESPTSNIAKSVITYKGMSLGTIAQEVVKVALQKPGGNLPITFASPREMEANDADHQRVYKGFNANTLSCEEVLQKISSVGKGPDITFRPKLVTANQMVWEMHHGTENNVRIKQKQIPQWDLTAPQGQTASLEVTKTGTYLTDRVIGVGNGTNEAALMAMSQNLSRLSQGYPLLETVYTDSETKHKSVLLRQTKENLEQNRKPLREFTLFVDAYGQYPLGTFFAGDLVVIYTKGFIDYEDGTALKMRLLNVSGAYGDTKVRLALQLDDQWK